MKCDSLNGGVSSLEDKCAALASTVDQLQDQLQRRPSSQQPPGMATDTILLGSCLISRMPRWQLVDPTERCHTYIFSIDLSHVVLFGSIGMGHITSGVSVVTQTPSFVKK